MLSRYCPCSVHHFNDLASGNVLAVYLMSSPDLSDLRLNLHSILLRPSLKVFEVQSTAEEIHNFIFQITHDTVHHLLPLVDPKFV